MTKAAQDARALARHVTGDVVAGLRAYSDERVPLSRAAYARSQMLGRYMMQAPGSGDAMDGRNNPNMEEIIRLTAIADF